MDSNKQKYLFRTFEWFNHPMSKPFMPIHLGISVEDGWFRLINKLAENIDKELGELKLKEKKDFYVVQIKEKFGGLRFYVTFVPNDKITKLIGDAEDESFLICEKCGKKGELRDNLPWILTLCNKCYSNKKKEYLIKEEKFYERSRKN